MATKKSVSSLKESYLKGMQVFALVDLNKPLDDTFKITTDTYIRAAVPTIKSQLGQRLFYVKEILKKGQNRIKTGQKQEAWRSREKLKAVTVNKARKTEQNAKRKAVAGAHGVSEGSAPVWLKCTVKCKRWGNSVLGFGGKVDWDSYVQEMGFGVFAQLVHVVHCEFIDDVNDPKTWGVIAYLSTHPSKCLNSFCYDDDDDEDYTSAITPDEPVLSTEEPNNSLSMGDEHLDTILATESNEFIKSSVETLILIPSESEGIPDHMCDVPSHDNSPPLDVSKDQIKDFSESNEEFSSIDDDSFSIDDIDYVEASPPDSELVSSEVMDIVIPETKSSSTSLNSLLEETNTSDNSLPEFETFCFDVKEISSGSTTTPPDISLLEYEVFHDDHVKEISRGSPTSHSDSSLYALFMFDLLINPFPPADNSDFYEFYNELIPFISPPEYDCFLFKVELNSRDFTKDVVEDISPTNKPQVHNTLPTHPTFQLNMKFQPSSEYLFTYVVWTFLPFLVYSVVPHHLLSLRNEDTIFDPDICNLTFSRPDISHRCRTVKKFNTYRSHLNKCLMMIHGQNNSPLDVLLFHFYPP
uniref:phosphoglycerate kinase n=1 Tax=Tanacetum cinerariifolium TaxID=118510 RepID=A0A6L2NDG9_TANCI|nr:phosphoglycerate kinase, cytosolic [Tanacetum cinerariifolium]